MNVHARIVYSVGAFFFEDTGINIHVVSWIGSTNDVLAHPIIVRSSKNVRTT